VLFLLRISFEVLLLVAIAPVPILWASLALLAGAATIANSPARRDVRDGTEAFTRGRWRLELSLLAVPPLLLLGCGLYFWEQPSKVMWLYVLGVLHLMLAMWLVWRHRRRLWPTFGISALSIWWAVGALFTALMAVTGTWL
jgi:hypothetical protein